MARFWVYVGDKVQGPVDIPSLRKVPGFNLLSQVCEEGAEIWRMADEVIEIKSYFISPPRPNSFALDSGNAAPKIEFSPQPMIEEMTLPEPNMAWQKTTAPSKSGDPNLEILTPTPVGGAALRAVCEVCGYKNPRDVAVCMKCGEKLKGAAAAVSAEKVAIPIPIPVAAPTPAPAVVAPEVDPNTNTMVEISMSKLLIGCAVAGAVIVGSFLSYRSWRKHHLPKRVMTAAPAAPAQKVMTRATKSGVKHYSRQPVRRPVEPLQQEDAAVAEPKTEEASYRVVPEAAPLKKRFSSPINSPYAVKRRANQSLWTSQEDQSIQQVQRMRIYGGLRTIDRNVEILMQILRDREYNTAFESGKRIYLYNDLDWSAFLKEGPLYDVHLTFSGGKEPDGSPKKPLHFAFMSDLERGTVEPGGQDQVRSNTLHAFFDESRIAPEDRRAIAKDTEELVLAAQPEASPLALDTVVRQFAKVYTTAALSRVADAYDLTLVKKKLAHDTRLGSDDPTVSVPSPAAKKEAPSAPSQTEAWEKAGMKPSAVSPAQPVAEHPSLKDGNSSMTQPIKGDSVEFRMERGAGRERNLMVRATSTASPAKIWEIVTGYDRLKQFMPDMLSSEREGQDGSAVIVHTVCLTRYLFFMFKMNFHWRVIEHPQQHTLEFERIAGDFESFRGSLEITTDPAKKLSQINFRAMVVPEGATLNAKLESMARRILIPEMNTLRTKAESN